MVGCCVGWSVGLAGSVGWLVGLWSLMVCHFTRLIGFNFEGPTTAMVLVASANYETCLES